MNIKITDNIRITTIPRNFVIEKKRKAPPSEKSKKREWDIVGYYPTLSSLLNGLVNQMLLQSEAESVAELA